MSRFDLRGWLAHRKSLSGIVDRMHNLRAAIRENAPRSQCVSLLTKIMEDVEGLKVSPASHEEREGEEPWPEFVSRVLDMAANSDEGPDVTLAEQGHAITRTEEWLRSRLRSHTDREPDDGPTARELVDHALAYFEAGVEQGSDMYLAACAELGRASRLLADDPVGPPVQPEEES